MAEQYPSDFPQPTRGNSIGLKMGVQTFGTNAGTTLVRRRFNKRVRTFPLSFSLKQIEVEELTEWFNDRVGEWIEMELASDWYEPGTVKGKDLRVHTVKLISDLSLVYNSVDSYDLSGVFEQAYA